MPKPPDHNSFATTAGRPHTLPRLAPLFALLALTLFPFGWLSARWPAFGQALDYIFASAAAHTIGHATLFALLGGLALAHFPALRAHPGRYVGMLFMVGIGQELFQLWYKQRALAIDDGRDLLVDLLGLAIPFALVRLGYPGREYFAQALHSRTRTRKNAKM